MNKKLEKLLYKELDGTLNSVEQLKLDKALKSDAAFQAERKELLNLREMVASCKEPEFKPFFETRLMQKLNNSASEFGFQELFIETLASQFRKILVPAMVIILVIVSYNLGTADVISFDSVFGIPDINYVDAVNPVNYLAVE